MQGFSSSFPRGGAGAGLLLLRLAVALQLLFEASAITATPWWQWTLIAVLAGLLMLGMLTPVAGALCAMYQLLCLTNDSWSQAPLPLIAAVTATALMLMGPGAF